MILSFRGSPVNDDDGFFFSPTHRIGSGSSSSSSANGQHPGGQGRRARSPRSGDAADRDASCARGSTRR